MPNRCRIYGQLAQRCIHYDSYNTAGVKVTERNEKQFPHSVLQVLTDEVSFSITAKQHRTIRLENIRDALRAQVQIGKDLFLKVSLKSL